MKNSSLRLLVIAIGLNLIVSTFASASFFEFNPRPNDLKELSHSEYFSWGINLALEPGEKIKAATLKFSNIRDWTEEEDDHLFIHLLDNPKKGSISYIDSHSAGDNFAGKGKLICDWSDPQGGSSRNFDLVIDLGILGFLDELNDYAATAPENRHGNFGFGIDPDCHYYNNGVTFSITTEIPPPNSNVPEPATMTILLAGGLLVCLKK